MPGRDQQNRKEVEMLKGHTERRRWLRTFIAYQRKGARGGRRDGDGHKVEWGWFIFTLLAISPLINNVIIFTKGRRGLTTMDRVIGRSPPP